MNIPLRCAKASLLALIVAIVLASIPNQYAIVARADVASEWPVVGQNLARIGFVDSSAPDDSHLLWKFKMDGVQASWGAIAVAEGKVFVGCESTGDLYAVNMNTGEQIWHRNVNQHAYLTYNEGKIYAMGGTMPHDPVTAITGDLLTCLDAGNGSTLWTYVLPQYLWFSDSLPFMPGSPAVYEGKVYKPTLGMVFIWDANNGTLLDMWATGDFSSRFISFYEGDIIGGAVNYTDGTTYVYRGDPATKTIEWVSPPIDSFGGCAISADNVYVAGYNYNNVSTKQDLYRIDARDGTIHWAFDSEGIPYSASVAYNRVYFGTTAGYVYCNDKFVAPVNENWKFKAGGGVTQDLAIADEKVFFGSLDGYVYAINAFNGELIWKYQTEGALVGAPAIADGKLFIGSNDRYLYCFGPAPSSSMSISAPASITVGQSLTLSGSLVNGSEIGVAEADVALTYRAAPATEWKSIATVTTSSDGSYSYTWTPPFDGYYDFNAHFQGPEIGGYASSNSTLTTRVAPTTPEVTVDLTPATDAINELSSTVDSLQSIVSTQQTYLIATLVLVIAAIAVSAISLMWSRKTST